MNFGLTEQAEEVLCAINLRHLGLFTLLLADVRVLGPLETVQEHLPQGHVKVPLEAHDHLFESPVFLSGFHKATKEREISHKDKTQ